MKNELYKKMISLLAVALFTVTCSEDFLTKRPLGSVVGDNMKSKQGIEYLVVGAYSFLDPPLYGWGKDPNNWVFGSICGGDANKGSESGDQPDINPLERYEANANNPYLTDKWGASYDGIFRCNDGIAIIENTPLSDDVDLSFKQMKKAELRFLRGFYYFELVKVFGPKIPYVDEVTRKNNINNPIIANDVEIWDKIEADFQYGIDSLPETWEDAGRANSWAAKAFMAKVKLFQASDANPAKWNEALALLTDVIENGVTVSGGKYQLLEKFEDNFDLLNDNSTESVFAIQNTVNDGTIEHSNPGNSLNFPYNDGPGGCCGFFQPSFSLVNSYKVDSAGLPLFTTYNNSDLKNDMGLASVDSTFFRDSLTAVDPRLDCTVGRRGVPYLDWGICPGQGWVRIQAYGGPYLPKKNVYKKRDQDNNMTEFVDGWAPGSALNTNLMRFADVLLMAAECEVEAGTLAKAMEYVNMIRDRASHSSIDMPWGTPAANYKIGLYTSFPDKDYARQAVRFERKLELAMEGHRFFDLRRWGNTVIQTELNAYVAHEAPKLGTHLLGAGFALPCDLYFPIPQHEIELSQGKLKQLNTGCAY